MIIRSKAPVRISFAGGGTDVSPFCEEYGGCVVNATINRYAWGSLSIGQAKGITLESYYPSRRITYGPIDKIKYDGDLDLIKAVIKNFSELKSNFRVFLESDVPAKSGLGSSASAFVAIIGLFNHHKKNRRISDYEIAELAFRLEREELKNPGGRQDQYAAVFGGLNFIEFKGNDFIRINPLRLKKDHLLELEKHLVLVNLGERRSSGDIIADQVDRLVHNTGETLDALHESKALAEEVKTSLLSGDLTRFGELLEKSWLAKKKFSPLISNPLIDKLYALAKRSGAIGGKITGAGGGGHMLFYCSDNKERYVADKLAQAGAKVINFSFDSGGLQTWELDH